MESEKPIKSKHTSKSWGKAAELNFSEKNEIFVEGRQELVRHTRLMLIFWFNCNFVKENNFTCFLSSRDVWP